MSVFNRMPWLFIILLGSPACSRTALEVGPFADDGGRRGTVASAGGGDVQASSGGSAQSNGGGSAACSGPLTWTCAPAVVSGQCCDLTYVGGDPPKCPDSCWGGQDLMGRACEVAGQQRTVAVGTDASERCPYHADCLTNTCVCGCREGAVAAVPGLANSCGVTLMANLNHYPTGVSVDDEFVYWTTYGNCPIDEDERGDGSVYAMRRSDGSAAVMLDHVACPDNIVSGGDDIYWFNQFLGGGWLSTAKRDGSQLRVLSKHLRSPHGLKVDAQSLYYFDSGGIYQIDRQAATAPRLLAKVNDSGDTRTPFVVDDSNVYWLDGGFGDQAGLFRVGISDGVPQRLAQVREPRGLAISSAGLFWSDAVGTANSLFFLAWGAAIPQSLAAPRTLPPGELAAFGTDLYWTETDDGPPGGVYHVNVDEPGVSLIDSEVGPYSIAADSQFVFWTQQDERHSYNGRVMRVCH